MADDEKERSAIAKRQWLNAKGEPIPTGDLSVAGFRYTYLATGNSYERMLPEPVLALLDPLDRGAWAMGGVTKSGNVVNTYTHDPEYENDDPIPAVVDFWGRDTWRDVAEGAARGPKYDKDTLAAALIEYLPTVGDTPNAGGVAHYRARLDDKSYYAKVRARPAVMGIYYRLMAEKGEAVQDKGGLA